MNKDFRSLQMLNKANFGLNKTPCRIYKYENSLIHYEYYLRCDVWSLGISVIECCEGTPPLSSLPPVRTLFHIAHNPPPGLQRPSEWSEDLKDFINGRVMALICRTTKLN